MKIERDGDSIETQWRLVEIHGDSVEIGRDSWRFSGDSMEIQWRFYGDSGRLVEIHRDTVEILWRFIGDTVEIQWRFIEIEGLAG